jgi:spermidine synthase
LVDIAIVPDGREEMRLYRRGAEFSIRVNNDELMNSREHFSEEGLAELACDHVKDRPNARVLIGGLGMGFTLAAALPRLKKDASIVVAELIPQVVTWNRFQLGELGGHPLRDPRVTVMEEDVGAIMRREKGGFDAIILDVDNGPEGFTRQSNDALYGNNGLKTAYNALKPLGVLTVWSAKPSRAFGERLERHGFGMQVMTIRSREEHRGAHHTVWMAVRVD